ncbi:hypothetical protein ACWD2L_05775 [Streptomyces sp. NPDC002754]
MVKDATAKATDGPEEFNPPADWNPPTPPTDPNEEELLAEAFGEPVGGIYAPHIPAVTG